MFRQLVPVSLQPADGIRQPGFGISAVKNRHIVPFFDQIAHQKWPNKASSTYQKDPHAPLLRAT
jgi:hypothetical protein